MSGGGMPELGSKISLISKADIRYEGRLYTVDPQECTIALSNVRSFGTEDRDTQFQIAPQSQIYDYILFRGSDIKDIRVINNSLPHHNDPAIMQVQMQNGGQHMMQPFPMQNMNAPPPQAVGGGGYGGPFGPMSGLGSGLGAAGNVGGAGAPGMGVSMAPGAGTSGPFMLAGGANQGPQQQQQPKPQQQQKSASNILGGGSRSTTPMSLISRKSPSDLMGFQQQLNQQNQQHMQQQHQSHMNQNQQQQHHQLNQNDLMGGSNGGHHTGGNAQRDAGQHKRQNHQQQRGVGGQLQQNQRERRDSGRNADSYNNQQQRHDGRNNYNTNHQRNNNIGAIGNGANNMNHRNWNMHRGGTGPTNAGSMLRSRSGTMIGGGRGGRIQNHQGYRPIGSIGGIKPRNQKTTIKFEQDFDFEQANNKFEELRSQFNKLKVSEEPKPSEQVNGETDKKEDSGNETGAGDHEHEEDDIVVGYDKTKSFFDNISCEAAQDRTKNKKNDWRQERKLNSETFGVSSTRRGSYRGRNNYYNRNMGGSVGYNRGFRSGNNYRNRTNNRTSNNRDNNTNSNAINKLNLTGGGSNANGTVTASSDNNANNTATGTPKTTQPQQGSQTPQSGAGANIGTPNATSRSTPAASHAGAVSASANATNNSNVATTTPSQSAAVAAGAGQ